MNSTGRARVLIADSDWDDFAAVVDAVEDLDVQLVWCATPADALAQLERGDAALLVADWEMQTESGESLFRFVKRRDEWRTVRTIVVAAPEDGTEHAEAFVDGADDILPRPFDARVFRARIVAGLRIRAAEREHLELERRRQLSATITTVAHEINNPLFAVMGNLEILREDIGPLGMSERDQSLRECLDTMRQECERIAGVVRRLRAIHDPTLTSYRGQTQMVALPEESAKF
jgi:DNA-binding response OmpR family regulator